MKKLIGLALALCLMLGLLPAALAQGTEDYQDFHLENQMIASLILLDGELLVQTNTGLYSLKPGDKELSGYKGLTTEAWMESMTAIGYGGTLVTDGERLMVFSFSTSSLTPLSVEEGRVVTGTPIELDLSSHTIDGDGPEAIFRSPDYVNVIDGRLYLIYRDFDGMQESSQLLSFSLEGGEPGTLELKGLRSLAGYKDGKLLVTMDPQDGSIEYGRAWDGNGPSYDLSVLDPKDGTVTRLGATGPSDGRTMVLGYDAKADQIYLMTRGELHRWDGDGKTTLCAYASSSNVWQAVPGNLSFLPDGRVLLAGNDTLSIRSADPALLPKGKVVIYGSHESSTHRRAAQLMRGLPVRYLDSKYFPTAQELGQALVSGEDEIDIFFLNAAQVDLNVLKSKGYCLDLSQSEPLRKFVSQSYPMMQQLAEHEGKLCLIPVEVSRNLMTYNEKLFKEIGLEPPQTFKELCELVAAWDGQYAEQFPNYLPVISDNYVDYLSKMALNLYADYCAVTGEEWSFRSPLLRELLEQAESVRQSDAGKPVDWSDPQSAQAMSEMYQKQELIQQGMSGSLADSGMLEKLMSLKPLRLQVKEGVAPSMPVSLQLLAVNPKSKRIETAIQYAEAYVQSLDGAVRVSLLPGENDAVPNPDYDVQMEQMNAVQQMLEKAVATAEGAELREQQRMLDEFKSQRATVAEELRYLVSEESIRTYREQMEQSYLRSYGPVEMLLEQEEMSSLAMRYQQGQISLDQFLNEAEGKYRLIRLENQ